MVGVLRGKSPPAQPSPTRGEGANGIGAKAKRQADNHDQESVHRYRFESQEMKYVWS
jgi:hypothetical protein